MPMTDTMTVLPFDTSGATLEEFLDFNCEFTEKRAIEVPRNGDLSPLFILIKQGEPGEVHELTWETTEEKALAIEWFKSRLHYRGADRYAAIVAAWSFEPPDSLTGSLTEEEMQNLTERLYREGTDAFPDLRKECYFVSVGDRTRTLTAKLLVQRDYKGKIRRLTRTERYIPGLAVGRMADLLVAPN